MHSYHYNLGSYFSQIIKNNLRNIALIYAERSYKYADLAQWIDRLSAFLVSQECSRGDVIAIAHTKKPLSYALMHACLRIGVAYVVTDVNSPVERTARILEVSGSVLLFYDDPESAEKMKELASTCNCRLQMLIEDKLPEVTEADKNIQQQLVRKVDGSTIAYIMFTSGSTGTPKGVAVTHQNVLHFIAWGRERFGITAEDNFANLSPMYFDNSVFDFYVGMFSGATLTPVPRELLNKPYELVTFVKEMMCTIWFSVPSLLIYLMTMKAISHENLASLRLIIFGGEGYPKVELKKLYDCFNGRAKLVNVYGPTECTCICSAHEIKDSDFIDMEGLPTLGSLNPNFDYLILSDDGERPDHGELCLLGPNVAAGYFNDPKRTAAAFTEVTEPERFMKRMYRTGDLVREVGGKLFFIGRKDNQIKHLGYRIELEEIEHALVKLEQVDQAAVIYQRENAAYGKLIGFVACSSPVGERELLSALARFLPSYMVPSKLVVINVLPKNPNGKVDRKRLLNLLEK
jgi:D-alanine--poly(phosphoribitol) ligase subunit 1